MRPTTPHTDDKIVESSSKYILHNLCKCKRRRSWTPCKNCHPNFVLSNKKKVRLVTRHSSFSQLSLEKNSVFQSFLSKVLKVRVGTKIYICLKKQIRAASVLSCILKQILSIHDFKNYIHNLL